MKKTLLIGITVAVFTPITVSANPLASLLQLQTGASIIKETVATTTSPQSELRKDNTTTKPKISLPNAHKISVGMTREEVIALVGSPLASKPSGEINTDTYSVQTADGIDIVSIRYESGIVWDISQQDGNPPPSNRNRHVAYRYFEALPAKFDGIRFSGNKEGHIKREEVIEKIGAGESTAWYEFRNKDPFKTTLRDFFADTYSMPNGKFHVIYQNSTLIARNVAIEIDYELNGKPAKYRKVMDINRAHFKNKHAKDRADFFEIN